MKRILLTILAIILCLAAFSGCDKECDHNWERISNYNESTAQDKCTKCGETRLYTDPDAINPSLKQNESILSEFDMYCTVSEINAANPKIIKLSKTDNVCQFGYGIESSAVGLGTYELTDTILTLTFEQGHVYVFNVVGDDMVFDADKSSTPVVEDGTVFKKVNQIAN